MAKTEPHTANVTPPDPKDQVKQDVDLLKNDLVKMKDDLKLLADSLIGRGKSKAAEVRRTAEDTWEQQVGQAQDFIEERPITTVMIAFGVGLLAGAIFSKK